MYDYIRMLDAPDYPNAFIEKSGYLFEFTDAAFDAGELTANVRIRIKD
jgi:methionyl-tRNA formyltransferase